jgi:hypothetical protein
MSDMSNLSYIASQGKCLTLSDMAEKRDAQLGVRITQSDKAWLERERRRLGLKSQADVVSHLIEEARAAPLGIEEAADSQVPVYVQDLKARLETVEGELRLLKGHPPLEGVLTSEEMELLAWMKRDRPETWRAMVHTASIPLAATGKGGARRAGKSRSKTRTG